LRSTVPWSATVNVPFRKFCAKPVEPERQFRF
jgi:hypothetical protein